MHLRRSVFFSRLLLALMLALSTAAAAQGQKPLKEADILKELAGGTSNKRIAAQVRQAGVAFSLAPGSEERLRTLGADDELIGAIRVAAAARAATGDEAPKPPLTESEILKGLAGRMSNQRLAELVGRYGIDFSLTPESEERLRALGANDELITVIRRTKPTLKGIPPGTVKGNPKDGLNYVWIPPGTFQMGCSPGDAACGGNEKPAHAVTLTKGFWMGQTEVTKAAYRQVTGASPSGDGDRMPVVNVNWDEANAYCGAVGLRLPTEAQWEYAARAGTTSPYYGDLETIAWYHKSSPGDWHEVAQKQSNAWKLYDMLGNVEEWTGDFYDGDYYGKSPAQDPPGPSSGERRAIRDNSWYSGATGFRVSSRDNDVQAQRRPGYGFRCAGDLP